MTRRSRPNQANIDRAKLIAQVANLVEKSVANGKTEIEVECDIQIADSVVSMFSARMKLTYLTSGNHCIFEVVE